MATAALAAVLPGQTRITGSGSESIRASVRGADGFIYATGVTTSPDFPSKPAAESGASASDHRPFVVKMDDRGQVVYATVIPAPTSSPSSIAVNAKGEVLIGGQTVELGTVRFPLTPGALSNSDANTGFLVKLDATGTKILVGVRGYGMGLVAFDSADNIYVAGQAYGDANIRPTPGAFQSAHDLRGCGGSGFVGIACFYQYVAKISPDGTKLLYSTFLTGTYGASPQVLLVDGEGNAIVAGGTSSSDYPTTPESYQPVYRAANPPPPPSSFRPSITPPPQSGFVTKLNSTGTGLIWSTFLSGTGADLIASAQWASEGRLFLTGLSSSRDLPLAQSFPAACPLGYYPESAFVAELSGDGRSLLASHRVYDVEVYVPDRVAIRADGTAEVIRGAVGVVDRSIANPYMCVTDPADNARLSQVAPGQLVTLFGDFAEGTAITVGGSPADVLYASSEQINLRVPEAVSGSKQIEVAASDPQGRESRRSVDVVDRAPSVFLDLTKPISPLSLCKGHGFSPGYAVVVRNEDGSLNSCENMALRGSLVTFYLNGLGLTAPDIRLEGGGGEILDVVPDPDSPAGVWRMRVRLTPGAGSGSLRPVVGGLLLRYGYLTVWVGP